MLELIKSLQDRVAKLEAQLASNTKPSNPAPHIDAVSTSPSDPPPTTAVAAKPPDADPHTESSSATPVVVAQAPQTNQESASTSEQKASQAEQQQQNHDEKYPAPPPTQFEEETPWNLYEPGEGFDVYKTERAKLNISGYLVARYLNQMPANQTFIDHLGNPQPVLSRQDFQLHRVMTYFTGFLYNPKFNYNITLWTVNDTTQVAIVGALYYAVNKHFLFGAGWNGLPGTISMQGSHPYWTSYDRVMADEFFRPFFTQGAFAEGKFRGTKLNYKFMVGNNLSQLGIKAVQLTRDLATGVALVWMPTTGEFGPRGSFGDYEDHEKFATRFGVGYVHSREDRFNSSSAAFPDNTSIRLGDSLLLFQTGALAPRVTVLNATYQLLSANGGIKYKGFWLQSEGYYRLLNHLVADGPLPVASIRDQGFYVQTSYMLVPRKIEVYGATSWIFPQFHAQGTRAPHEALGGINWYPTDSRNYRLNAQVISVNRSPVNSTFGFYTGGLKGTIFAIGATTLF